MEFYLEILQNGNRLFDAVLKRGEAIAPPLFEGEEYQVNIYDVQSAQLVSSETIVPDASRECRVQLPGTVPPARAPTIQEIVATIQELVNTRGLNSAMANKIELLQRMRSDLTYSRRSVKGGRLEQLMTQLLEALRGQGVVDKVEWHGRVDPYGVPSPAPGGVPDLLVCVDNLLLVLELTLIRDSRGQWAYEGASVPDHVIEVAREYPGKDVIGVFAAPDLHDPLKTNLRLQSKAEKLPMLTYQLGALLQLLMQCSRQKLVAQLTKDAEHLVADE